MVGADRDIVARVTLTRPIKQGSEEIAVLEFTEPTLNDVDNMERAAKFSNAAAVMKLIEKTAAVPPSTAQAIKAVDLPRIMDALRPFLPSALPGVEAGAE